MPLLVSFPGHKVFSSTVQRQLWITPSSVGDSPELADVFDIHVTNFSDKNIRKGVLLYLDDLVEDFETFDCRCEIVPCYKQSTYDWCLDPKDLEELVPTLAPSVSIHREFAKKDYIDALLKSNLRLTILQVVFGTELRPKESSVFRIKLRPKCARFGLFEKAREVHSAQSVEPKEYQWFLKHWSEQQVRTFLNDQAFASSGSLENQSFLDQVQAIYLKLFCLPSNTSFYSGISKLSVAAPSTFMVSTIKGGEPFSSFVYPSESPNDTQYVVRSWEKHDQDSPQADIGVFAKRLYRQFLSKADNALSDGELADFCDPPNAIKNLLLESGIVIVSPSGHRIRLSDWEPTWKHIAVILKDYWNAACYRKDEVDDETVVFLESLIDQGDEFLVHLRWSWFSPDYKDPVENLGSRLKTLENKSATRDDVREASRSSYILGWLAILIAILLFILQQFYL